MSHGHCQCGQISWKIDVMMSHLVILHISWNSKSPSTYFTFSRNMTCHFMMVQVHKKIFQTLSTLLTQSHGFRWNTFPPYLFSPRAAERCTVQGWKSKQSQSFTCCRWYWDCGELSMMFKFSNYSPPGLGIRYWWLYAMKWEETRTCTVHHTKLSLYWIILKLEL